MRGMTTISYWADDVSAARDWYREVLGIDAHVQRPDAEHSAYVGFRVGDHEHEPITERGPGFVTAAMTDPFGNVLGVMYNQHDLDRLAQDATQPATAPTERSLA